MDEEGSPREKPDQKTRACQNCAPEGRLPGSLIRRRRSAPSAGPSSWRRRTDDAEAFADNDEGDADNIMEDVLLPEV